jgi:hypothetical protein
MQIINVLHRGRIERRELLHGYKNWALGHVQTLSKIIFTCKQLLVLLPRFSWKTMAEIHGRIFFSKFLASADKTLTEITLKMKNTRIAKGKGRSDKE